MTGRSGANSALVVLDLGFLTLPIAVHRARRGWTVRYLHTHVRRPWVLRLLERSGVTALRLEEETALVFGDHTYNGPSYAAASYLSAPAIEPLLERVAQHLTGDRAASGALRAALHNDMTSNAQDLFSAEMWVRSRQFERGVIVVHSPWDKILLKGLGVRSRIVRVPVFGSGPVLAVTHLIGQMRMRPATTRAPALTDGSPARDERVPGWPRPVMFVFNRGSAYRRLYNYEHLLSTDPASPFHASRAVNISRSGGDLGDGRQADPFPVSRTGTVQLWHALSRASAWWTIGRRNPRVLWWCARFSVRVEDTSRQIRERYPEVRLAVLAFEMQVPPYLAMSMRKAGIRTASLQERPAIAFDRAATTIVDTLLTASQYISHQVQRSETMAVDHTVPTGMWRCDLVYQARRSATPPTIRAAQERGQRVVLVLPYHAETSALRATDPICTSIESVRHFLNDIIDLARDQRDAHFIIRGKDAAWVDDPRFQETIGRLDETPNAEVNRDYESFNVTYGLAAHCDLIIAKPTSLVDEALALGIPCLLHDYTHNSSDYAREQLPYLPRELWALDKDDLRSKVRSQLVDDGRAFRGWWEPTRDLVYGNLNDGHVRERARRSLEEILRASSLA